MQKILEKQLNFASSYLNMNTVKPWVNKHGYWYFIYEGKIFSLHREIAMSQIPNPHNYGDVNHIDGDKSNNHPENLEWVTRSQNLQHALDLKLRRPAFLGKFGADNPSSKPIVGQSVKTNETLCFAGLQEAARNGFSAPHICRVLKGRRNHHKGYIWSYAK